MPRKLKWIDVELAAHINKLGEHFEELFPRVSKDLFVENVLRPMISDPKISAISLMLDLNAAAEMTTKTRELLAALSSHGYQSPSTHPHSRYVFIFAMGSCAACAQALAAVAQSQTDDALLYFLRAVEIYGISVGFSLAISLPATNQIWRKGVRTRHAQNRQRAKQIRDWFEANGAKYPSKNRAAVVAATLFGMNPKTVRNRISTKKPSP